jgi:rod shape determining protein RodA
MIRRRSWRRFDYLLLGALLLLSAYGALMIYSATINTLGVEDAVRRQIIYLIAGTAVLLVTASIDYRLLDIVQHPFAGLTPLMLGLVSMGMVLTWRVGQLPEVEAAILAALLLADIAPVLLGPALVLAVYTIDRLWVSKIDLVLTRFVLAVTLVLLVSLAVLVLTKRLDNVPGALQLGPQLALTPYLMIAGLAVAYLLDCLTLRITDILRNPIYVLILLMLGIIFLIGQVAGGSQRWLGAGAVQPSELAKILVIIVLAKFFADHEARMERFSTVLVSLAVVALPMLLIYLQPDLGTALTLLAIWVVVAWMAKVRLRHMLFLGGVGVIALPLAWFGLQDYMRQRLLLFLNPASDPDSYFNVHQALVSIGSGGWTGKGLTHGTQSQLHFLRVRHTDFIFAVTAEELGFLGAVALMGLQFFVLWRIVRIADRSEDILGRLIAAGVASLILFQSLVNIGMNLGLMPVTGIPLPFVSYGGSSFMTLMLGIGLVESVSMRQKKLEFD